jgi:hypothetical protein
MIRMRVQVHTSNILSCERREQSLSRLINLSAVLCHPMYNYTCQLFKQSGLPVIYRVVAVVLTSFDVGGI